MEKRKKSDNTKGSLSASRGSFVIPDPYLNLSEEQIDGFIELYKRHFGVELDRETARQKGAELCRFVEMVDFRFVKFEDHE